MVSSKNKLKFLETIFNTVNLVSKRIMSKYAFDQRKSVLDTLFILINKTISKSKEAGYNCRFMDNLFSQFNPAAKFAFRKKFGFRAPAFFTLNPTNACDKRCYGCYAAELGKNNSLSFEVMDKILEEAKKIGIHFVTITGGEPFFSPNTLKLFEKHRDITFLVYTHGGFLAGDYPESFVKKKGLLQGEKLVKKLAELGNVQPAISQEGYEKETDLRRGKGTYEKIARARELMNKYGIIHGASLTVTSLNFKLMTDEKFFEHLISQGCDLVWMFSYVPIGRAPSIKLMLTPKQRLKIADFSMHIRKKYGILVGDFRESAGFSQGGGCMMAGRAFFNIQGSGNVAPCAFVPFHVDNVKKLYKEFYVKKNKNGLKTLLSDAEKAAPEARQTILAAHKGLLKNWKKGPRILPFVLSRGMFVEMRLAQEKLLRGEHGPEHRLCVCSALDHPHDVVAGNIKKWNAVSSDEQPTIVEDLSITRQIKRNQQKQAQLAKIAIANYEKKK